MVVVVVVVVVCTVDVCLLRVKYKSCGWQAKIKTSAMIYNFRLDGDTNEILFLDKIPALNVKTEEHEQKIQNGQTCPPSASQIDF